MDSPASACAFLAIRDVDHARLLAIFATSCPAAPHAEGWLNSPAQAFTVLDVDHAVFPAFFAMGGNGRWRQQGAAIGMWPPEAGATLST